MYPSPPEIGFIEGAPIEEAVVKREQQVPPTPPRLEPERPPSPTPTPPPAQKDITPRGQLLEEEFPAGSYGEWGLGFGVWGLGFRV